MEQYVTIKRREINTQIPKDILMSGRMKMGSFFKGGMPATGLTRPEINRYMPDIINMEVEDKGFRQAVRTYYADMSIEVEPGGVKLQVGLDDNKFPINLEHYLKYRFALVHPDCNNKDQPNKPKARFVMVDPQVQKQKQNDDFAAKMAAYRAYETIQSDDKKVRQVLVSLGVKMAGIGPDGYTLEIQRVIEATPVLVTQAIENPMLSVIAAVHEGLQIGLLTDINGQVFLDNDRLGGSVEEAAKFLKAPENHDTRKNFLARLKTSTKVVS